MNHAHWKKCDFQVHTPRDPNWAGSATVGLNDIMLDSGGSALEDDVDASRMLWAHGFVSKCVEKGLEAVALTDHHEMVMFSYAQRAILECKQADPAFDLWLFPGMELTTKGGSQSLIIFDADLSEDWLQQAQGKLGIAYADQDSLAAKGKKVTQLSINFADLADELDTLAGLRGRYIILPNVSQGGRHTVLTNGNHSDFKRMPYVGGYLDSGQTKETLNTRSRQRLSGTDSTWSDREIYPIPTSDSRTEDFQKLGLNNTWIKLSEPTAEAIRQAFLGHQSRIRIEPPHSPSLFVKNISIENSGIIQNTNLSLSPELNTTIGGRGSGKSSLIEYLSFGLGRSCYDLPRDAYSGTQRLNGLIKDTIISKSGCVRLSIVQDNAVFEVERSAMNAYQPLVTYPNGQAQTVTVKELRSLFPAVVYSQGELAEIGKQAGNQTQLTDLLQFVNPEYKREDDSLVSSIEAARGAVRSALQILDQFWRTEADVRQQRTNKSSLEQRAQALEKTLPKHSAEDQATIELFDKSNNFNIKRLQASKHTEKITEELDALTTELLNERDTTSDLKLPEVENVQSAYSDIYKTFSEGFEKLRSALVAKREAYAAVENDWAEKYTESREARDSVLEKLSEHKTVTAQIIKLREEISNLTTLIADGEAKLKALGDPMLKLNTCIASLESANQNRTVRTQSWALEIQRLSSGKIKAEVDPVGDVSEISDAIELLSTKTGSKEATRLKGLEAALAVSSPKDVVATLRAESLSLLYWQKIGAASGSEEPECAGLMGVLGNTDSIRSSVIELMSASRVEAISTCVPKPQIALYYCDGDREISFEKASEGQRAAALLFMLLEQPGGPLIIDQPEGDLDNKIITDLTEKLHSAKQVRQLVFVSHNANIVVNGSSELVLYLDVDDAGDRKVACIGAIDRQDICDVITTTMEGGEKAFKDRQDKYGY